MGNLTAVDVLSLGSQPSLMQQLLALEYRNFGKVSCTKSDFQVLQPKQPRQHVTTGKSHRVPTDELDLGQTESQETHHHPKPKES